MPASSATLHRLILLAAVATLTGCVIVSRNHETQEVPFSEPPVGSVATARVGDSLLQQGLTIELDAIHVPRDVPVVYAFQRVRA